MSGSLHTPGGFLASGLSGALIVLLSACAQPAFLSRPHTDAALATIETSNPVTRPVPIEEPAVERSRAPSAAVDKATPPPDPDLWHTIGTELTLQAPPRQRSSDPLKHFGYSRRYIATATARAKPYLSHVWAEVQKRKLPAEVVLIPLIESSYNNSAGKLGGPAGLWQFIPATGTRFGLQVSEAYDGRKDVVAGTSAALDYLAELGQRFDGDWLLAIAAYNCGERTVEDAISRNRSRARPTDFWSLDLPSGTRHYIPRLLDLSTIIQRPDAYGVSVARISSEPYFEALDVGGNVDLRRVARKSGLYPNEFDALNAAYGYRSTLHNRPTTVLVARGFGLGVRELLASLPPEQRLPARHYTVVAGDTLSAIAARHAVSVTEITRTNRLTSPRLSIGQRLSLPGSTGMESRVAERTAAARPTVTGTSTVRGETESVHVVRHGDNLWDVARHYHISARALAAANRITVGSTLRLGQRLHIPVADASLVATASQAAPVTHYKVRSGDSLWTISRRFKVSINKLRLWNGQAATRFLQPGERLIVQQRDAGNDDRKI